MQKREWAAPPPSEYALEVLSARCRPSASREGRKDGRTKGAGRMTAEQQVEARKRGSPKDTIRSARTIELIEMLEQNAPGWDPVIYLAKIAAGLIHTEEATLENRMDAARAVMPYLRPKLAAVSVELNSTETKVRRLVIEGLHQSMQAEALLEGEAVEP